MRDSEKASLVHKVSRLTGVSVRQVYRVINGESENEDVMRCYMELAEGENKLLLAVKELIPFKS